MATFIAIMKIIVIILCAVSIITIITMNSNYFKLERKECIIQDIFFCLPIAFFMVALSNNMTGRSDAWAELREISGEPIARFDENGMRECGAVHGM